MRISLVICFFGCWFATKAQQFRFENFSVNDGLPQSQVYCQLQDANGFLWMGTMGGGIARFDGQNFTTFTTRDGLPNNFVHCIYEFKDTLWIGTQKGLCYFNGQDAFVKKEVKLVENQQVIAFYKGEDRTWLGTNRGLFEKVAGEEWQEITQKFNREAAYIACIYKDKKGNLLAGGSQGVFQYSSSGEYRRIGRSDGFRSNDIECFANLNDSVLLIGTYGTGVYQLSAGRIQQFRTRRNLRDEIVHDIFVDDKVWIGTQNGGLYAVDKQSREVEQFSQQNGLANNHVRTILKDNWGTYWIGTSGAGVSKYFGQSFVHYNAEKGLPGNYIYSMHQASDNSIWFGVSKQGVVRKDSSGFSTFNSDSGFLDIKVKAIAEDEEQRMWFGTLGQGVFIYDGKRFKQLPKSSGMIGRFVKDLEHSGNTIWAATIDKGIFEIRPSGKGSKIKKNIKKPTSYTVRQYTIEDGILSNRINVLCADGDKMWYGSQSKGVGYIQNGKVVDLKQFNFPSWQVRGMQKDEVGNIWIATGGSGIVRIYQDASGAYAYKEFGYNSGLLSTNIYQVLPLGSNIYCGSENGVDELTLNEEFEVIESRHYGYDEGFIGVETCQDASMADNEGNIWFGTINGLSQFKPSLRVNSSLTPKISFTNIKANLTPLKWLSDSSSKKLGHAENTLLFEFVGLDLSRPKSVIYSYKLEGADDEWSTPNKGNTVRYPNLKAGEYQFMVRASSDGANWSPIRIYAFKVTAPFWKTWWFWLLCLVLLSAVAYTFIAYRLKRVEQRAEEERLQYQLKNDLLKLEQKALRLQMNPHFLFNALNSIQGLIIKNDQKSARYYLAKFAHLMRQILDNSRKSSVNLEEEIKTLENYLLIEKLSKKDSFEYGISVAENINQSTLQIPPMLIQPFVENAIIHAFTGLEKTGQLDVEMMKESSFLKVTITDNGIGRKRAGEISKQGINRESVGIDVTEQRLQAHNADITYKAVEINDLIRGNTALGTEAIVRIRIEQ